MSCVLWVGTFFGFCLALWGRVSSFCDALYFCWNVRGLNDPSKRNAVRAVVSGLRNVVVCLQESKVNFVSGSFLRSFGGPCLNKCVFLEANGASRGVITGWSSRFFTCREVIVRKFSITVHLASARGGSNFFLSRTFTGHPLGMVRKSYSTN